jgi:hypothetical protein
MSIIRELINSKGEIKSHWKLLLSEIISDNSSNNREIFDVICESLTKDINLDLIIDIIDFIFDYGNDNLIGLLLIQCPEDVYHLNSNKGLKTNEGTAIKNLNLIKKLNGKYGNKNEKIKIFYEKIISQGIQFPKDDEEIITYLKYIMKDEIQESINISQHQKKIINMNLMKTIHSEINSFIPRISEENTNQKNLRDNSGAQESPKKLEDKSNIIDSNIYKSINNLNINKNKSISNMNNNNNDNLENENNNNIKIKNSISKEIINDNNLNNNKSNNQMNEYNNTNNNNINNNNDNFNNNKISQNNNNSINNNIMNNKLDNSNINNNISINKNNNSSNMNNGNNISISQKTTKNSINDVNTQNNIYNGNNKSNISQINSQNDNNKIYENKPNSTLSQGNIYLRNYCQTPNVNNNIDPNMGHLSGGLVNLDNNKSFASQFDNGLNNDSTFHLFKSNMSNNIIPNMNDNMQNNKNQNYEEQVVNNLLNKKIDNNNQEKIREYRDSEKKKIREK